MLFQHTFNVCTEGICTRIGIDGKLFNISCLRARIKISVILMYEMLFADHAALSSHTDENLQEFVSYLAHTCRYLNLTIFSGIYLTYYRHKRLVSHLYAAQRDF